MSSSSSYHSTPFSSVEPALPLPQPEPQPIRPSPHDHSRQRLPQPFRQSSPRLFRAFFNAMSDGASHRQAILPRPVPSHQDSSHEVNRALENANRAVQDANEAFQARRPIRGNEARRLRTDSEVPSQPVDLTAQTQASASPQRSDSSLSAQSHYISQTTHPHDSSSAHRSRRLNALDEPVYGPRHTSSDHHRPGLSASFRFWHAGPGALLDTNYPLVDGRLPPTFEEEAISRQRENHQNWERTQARSRHRQRAEQGQTQSQSQSQSQSQDPPQGTMSPPSSSLRSTTHSSHRHHLSTSDAEAEDPLIESVDLTAVDDSETLSAALAKQRQDAILAQNPGTAESGRTSLTAYKCPVCMDTPTDATSTACGHVFCHRCIVDTLKWSIETRRENMPASRKTKGVCPVCRKTLDMKDTPGAGRGLIPLELKLMVRKRKREDDSDEKVQGKGKGKARGTSLAKAETLSDDEGDEHGGKSDRGGKKTERDTLDEALWGTFINEQA
ncbi:uncharacterized protein PV07_00094 [Cladophialophora immunda]|uniref:RING-type domain-containing protein n=1 Tax=Cladophialophora immunda TaxID=569365 RepID=A0A0D2B6J7_9EURO|nr:uncharacterized protein PV07_00094 [Cladophialophora immunda]KIW33227.1 hypothetical protein PV07_00094 [Cladophialophora immunda]OQV00014.1 hypothetical protein CLAIMM_05572 isoform 1 [Cladophialophora immunda]OQV00015.1 hypothetical protein CLAIMM_05572 isoform 2 [Cladophialophora immunda]